MNMLVAAVPVAGHRAADADGVGLVGGAAHVDRRPEFPGGEQARQAACSCARRGGGSDGGDQGAQQGAEQRETRAREHQSDDSAAVGPQAPVSPPAAPGCGISWANGVHALI